MRSIEPGIQSLHELACGCNSRLVAHIVRLAGDEGDRDFATADYPVQTEARFQLDLIVVWRRIEPVKGAAVRAIRRAAETKAADNILMAETIKLQVHYILKGKRHDGVPVENEITAIIHLFRRIPGVKAERTRRSPVQTEAHDLSIVKTWDTSKPCDQIAATRDAGVDCFGFVHIGQESSPTQLVK